jgi:hypothetical protein
MPESQCRMTAGSESRRADAQEKRAPRITACMSSGEATTSSEWERSR